jgi:hypothetical protein
VSQSSIKLGLPNTKSSVANVPGALLVTLAVVENAHHPQGVCRELVPSQSSVRTLVPPVSPVDNTAVPS